tara:strand:- start:2286 stop:2801 length:516 start_codon:yes stop_codon:yes gene_type:complete
MSKKYSSYDKNQLLCETFRKFALEENTWSEDQDPNLIDPPGRPGKKRFDREERNAGVNDKYPGSSLGSLTSKNVPAVLSAIQDFLKSHLSDGPTENTPESFREFFAGNQEISAADMIEASTVSYLGEDAGPLTIAMHDLNLFDKIRHIQHFPEGEPTVVAAVLSSIQRKTP